MAQKRMLRIIWAVSALKLLIVANIPQTLPTSYPGAWLGTDGETYLDVARVLKEEGVVSSDSRLLYFAPGYSAFLWMVSSPNQKLVFLSLQLCKFWSLATLFITWESNCLELEWLNSQSAL